MPTPDAASWAPPSAGRAAVGRRGPRAGARGLDRPGGVEAQGRVGRCLSETRRMGRRCGPARVAPPAGLTEKFALWRTRTPPWTCPTPAPGKPSSPTGSSASGSARSSATKHGPPLRRRGTRRDAPDRAAAPRRRAPVGRARRDHRGPGYRGAAACRRGHRPGRGGRARRARNRSSTVSPSRVR